MADAGAVGRLHVGGLVEQYYVAELYLLDDQILDIVLLQVLLHQTFSSGKLIAQPHGVHYGDYAVQTGNGAVPLESWIHAGHGADGTGNRVRLADTAGLDDDVVKPLHSYQLCDLIHQVGLQGTAYTTILQGYQAVVLSAYYPASLDKVRVYVHFSDIVYYNCKPDTFLIGENPVHQCCLPAAQISGKEQHRDFLSVHILYFMRSQN